MGKKLRIWTLLYEGNVLFAIVYKELTLVVFGGGCEDETWNKKVGCKFSLNEKAGQAIKEKYKIKR